MLVTLRGQMVHCREGIISGSFYLLFFILSAARAILISLSSELSYRLIPINLHPKRKVFSCFRTQREFHLFIAAMICMQQFKIPIYLNWGSPLVRSFFTQEF